LVLALALTLLQPGGAQAGPTAEKSCSIEKLKATGKALQCRLAALGAWVSKPDLRAWEKSAGQCRARLADAFGNAERRYGADACASSVTAAELNAVLDVGERSVSSAPLRGGRCSEGCYPYPRLPLAPRIDGVVPGDGSLAIRLSPAPEDVDGPQGGCIYSSGTSCRYPVTQFFVTAELEAGGEKITTTRPCRPPEQPCTIEGLVNGERYVVRAAANSHVGTSDGTPDFTGPYAEAGTWRVGANLPPSPDYPELLGNPHCRPGQGGSMGIRDVWVTIDNWLDVDVYIKERGATMGTRTQGRIPAGKRGYRCTSVGNMSLNSPTYHQMDVGYGQVPVARDPGNFGTVDGPQTIDMQNLWFGYPWISIGVKDPTLGGSTYEQVFRASTVKDSQGSGGALAWAGKYFYMTRERDDSCANDQICWKLVISKIPAGVPAGTSSYWSGVDDHAPNPVPAPSPVPYRPCANC